MSAADDITTDTPERPAPRRAALFGFLVLHLLLIATGGVWAALRIQQVEAEKQPPPFLAAPLTVELRYDVPEVISHEQLRETLWKLRPRFRRPNPRTNHVDHALRFWGIESTFDDPECLSGVEMRELLLDHRQFAKAWEEGTPSLLMKTLYGVRARVASTASASSHVDHTVTTLAEVGTPLDYPIVTEEGETTFRAMLESALNEFSLNQIEYEWSAMVFALYAPTNREWLTQEGQAISFDRLADRIMRQELTQGVCFGNHRLFALALMLQIDEQQPILSPESRQRILSHLKQVTATLLEHQHADGYWDHNWDGKPREGSASDLPPIQRQILATGHALEWWAIAPREVHPPKENLVRAGQWLHRTIAGLSMREVDAYYTFLSHAGRALALWRGKFPAEVINGSPSASTVE